MQIESDCCRLNFLVTFFLFFSFSNPFYAGNKRSKWMRGESVRIVERDQIRVRTRGYESWVFRETDYSITWFRHPRNFPTYRSRFTNNKLKIIITLLFINYSSHSQIKNTNFRRLMLTNFSFYRISAIFHNFSWLISIFLILRNHRPLILFYRAVGLYY